MTSPAASRRARVSAILDRLGVSGDNPGAWAGAPMQTVGRRVASIDPTTGEELGAVAARVRLRRLAHEDSEALVRQVRAELYLLDRRQLVRLLLLVRHRVHYEQVRRRQRQDALR